MIIKKIQFKHSLVQMAFTLAASSLLFAILTTSKQVNADTSIQTGSPSTLASSNYDNIGVTNPYNQDNYHSQSSLDGKSSIAGAYGVKSIQNGTFNQSRFDYLKQQEINQKNKYYKINAARIKNLQALKVSAELSLANRGYKNNEYTKSSVKNKIKKYNKQIKYLEKHIIEYVPHNSLS